MYRVIIKKNNEDYCTELYNGIYDNCFEFIQTFIIDYIINNGSYNKKYLFTMEKEGPVLDYDIYRSLHYCYIKSDYNYVVYFKYKRYGYLYNDFKIDKVFTIKLIYDPTFESQIDNNFRQIRMNKETIEHIKGRSWGFDESEYTYTC